MGSNYIYNYDFHYGHCTYEDIAEDWGLWCYNLAPDGCSECSWTVEHLMDEDAFYQASIDQKVKLLVQELGPE
jgi:hypothetical protein